MRRYTWRVEGAILLIVGGGADEVISVMGGETLNRHKHASVCHYKTRARTDTLINAF